MKLCRSAGPLHSGQARSVRWRGQARLFVFGRLNHGSSGSLSPRSGVALPDDKATNGVDFVGSMRANEVSSRLVRAATERASESADGVSRSPSFFFLVKFYDDEFGDAALKFYLETTLQAGLACAGCAIRLFTTVELAGQRDHARSLPRSRPRSRQTSRLRSRLRSRQISRPNHARDHA